MFKIINKNSIQNDGEYRGAAKFQSNFDYDAFAFKDDSELILEYAQGRNSIALDNVRKLDDKADSIIRCTER